MVECQHKDMKFYLPEYIEEQNINCESDQSEYENFKNAFVFL